MIYTNTTNVASVLICAAIMAGISCARTSQCDHPASITTATSLTSIIRASIDDTSFVTSSDIGVTLLDNASVRQAKDAAALALRQYPPRVIESNLHRVYVLKIISLYNRSKVLGLNSSSRGHVYAIFEPCPIKIMRHTGQLWHKTYIPESAERQLQRTIHHELSSILRDNYIQQFPHAEWMKANPNGFEYPTRPSEDMWDETWDPRLCEHGFLCKYAQSHPEEDFNVIAAELFMGEPEFWLLVDKYPALRNKVDIAVHFYHNIDCAFTFDSFRSLATVHP